MNIWQSNFINQSLLVKHISFQGNNSHLKSSFIGLFAQDKLKENVDMKEELNNSKMCYLTS